MTIAITLLLAASPPALSTAVEISPAVRAVGRKHGKTDRNRWESKLLALEKSGDRSAAAVLGEILQQPEHAGGPDFVGACNHSEKAGEHPEGLHNLATCYFTGQGRPRDLVKARNLYKVAAERGFARAACAYGNMLIGGVGGPADIGSGLDFCKRAADAGDIEAMTDYGGYLLTGRGGVKDAIAARQYLAFAAEKDQHNAQYLLGQIYLNGDGVAASIPDAAAWLIKAYDGGRKDAAYLVGIAAMRMIVNGAKSHQEVPTFVIDQAQKWLGIAQKEDPNPAYRAKATEGLKALDLLLKGR